jgi:lipopolysaccharide biosynthesis glycosyltransferase
MKQTTKKINSPLDALTAYLKDDATAAPKETTSNIQNKIILEKIQPENIVNWKFSDRPSNELGNIEELGRDILQNGQIHPV